MIRHAVGFMGPNGRGTPEHFGVSDRIDIITGTLGKALGGASGGYTSGRKPIDRSAASEIATVSVFQHSGSANRGRFGSHSGVAQRV